MNWRLRVPFVPTEVPVIYSIVLIRKYLNFSQLNYVGVERSTEEAVLEASLHDVCEQYMYKCLGGM